MIKRQIPTKASNNAHKQSSNPEFLRLCHDMVSAALDLGR